MRHRQPLAEASRRTSEVALRAFSKLADRWQLEPKARQVLLGVPERTYYNWIRSPEKATPDRDKLERISYVLGIRAALAAIFGENPEADEWLKRRNIDFGGESPLNRMLGGNLGDLAQVRAYLDRARFIW